MKRSFLIVYVLASFFLVSCNTMNSAEKEAEAKNKRIAAINVKLGMGYLERGEKDRAKQKLLYALQRDPKSPEAWYSMAYLQESNGNKLEAKKDYMKAVGLAPNRGDVQNNYGTFLCRSGEYQEAVNHFLMATKDPQYLDQASAYENAGLCALKIPDKKQAATYFRLALEQDPTRDSSMTELTKLK